MATTTTDTSRTQQPLSSSDPPTIETVNQTEAQQSQTTVSIDNDPPPPIDTLSPEAPPTYDGPVPVGTVLLCGVSINFDKEPTFFDTHRPDLLAGKVEYNTYLHRMTELNLHLNTKASLNSMKYLARFRIIGSVLFGVCVVTAVVVFLVIKSQLIFALILIPFIYSMLVPMNAQYVSIVENFAKKWTEEDALLGNSLVYEVQKIRPERQQTRIDVVLLIFEKTVIAETGRRAEAIEDLPTYSPV